ncbi:hypothetical protein OG563_26645 [Nocardia vinacea]|uniref:ClpX-type ZB domain-containing protein n=1 Tax=Nocardia vinacea TaxID=96468 RepID=A0ABZ1YHY3_9NOCA|nr:hypothetical protein [Nocardia vinacea]
MTTADLMAGIAWRYDVFECGNHSLIPGAHDEGCRGWCRLGLFTTNDWALSFISAAALPHGVVMRVGINTAPGSVSAAFEHIAGGGLCDSCEVGRGVMRHSAMGSRFICDACVTELRAHHRRLFGTTSGYIPLLDDAREALGLTVELGGSR